jgi:hypothetical protein
MMLEIEADGVYIREKKRPNDLFLNIFKGKKLAKCSSPLIAKILVESYEEIKKKKQKQNV